MLAPSRFRAVIVVFAVFSLGFAGCGGSSPTQPEAAEKWSIDAYPLPGLLLIGQRVPLVPVALDSGGGLHLGVTGSSFAINNTDIAEMRGDTLVARRVGYAKLTTTGTWQGLFLTSTRGVFVNPSPVAGASTAVLGDRTH